jgi:RNA polymerase sigma-70 factor (subfamily 1)
MTSSAPDPADGDNLRRAIGGDTFALQALLLTHRARLLQYVTRQMPAKVRSVHDPDDVVQDVFVEACRRIAEFVPAGDDAVARWLMTIARHRIIDAVRAHGAVKRGGGRLVAAVGAGDDDGGRGVVALLESLAVYRRTPSRSAAAHELAVTLIRSIDGLPKDYRDAIWLRHVDGLPVKVAAARMNRTEGAFHLLCHRGLKQLRVVLRSASIYV